MRTGETKILVIDGKDVASHYIGRGMFCTAYRSGNRVYLLCKGDWSKECISMFCDKSIQHMPNIVRHEAIAELPDHQIYSMPFYRRLTKRDYPKAYAQWRTLPTVIRSYSEASQYIDSEQNNTPSSIRECIRELIEAFCNYDIDTMMLEFNRANLGVDENGELILRDCLVSWASVLRIRQTKKRRENAG